MSKLTLLFSSAGRRVELIQCFRDAARNLKIDLVVIAIDMDPSWSPACQVADLCFRVSRCTTEEFPGEVAALCKQHGVNLIIPTIDPELPVYASIRDFLAANGTEVLVSSEAFIRVARDKEATAHILSNHGIPVPRTWSIVEVLEEKVKPTYPLLLKPKAGSCSKGIVTINSRDELGDITDATLYVLQEICTGLEFTINCFYDRSGACMACVPHFRKFVRDGEVCFAQTKRVPAFTEIAYKFSEIFEKGLWGCLCFQGYLDHDEQVKVFEINARFGGGYPICDRAGGTFAKWILQDLRGQKPDYHDNWREGGADASL